MEEASHVQDVQDLMAKVTWVMQCPWALTSLMSCTVCIKIMCTCDLQIISTRLNKLGSDQCG